MIRQLTSRAGRRAEFALLLLLGVPSMSLGCRAAEREPESDGPARRIASRTVFADEVLWAMGPDVQARVVGLSPMADDPRYSTVAGDWPETTARLGRNPEELLALAPDLVILASFSEVEYRAALEGKVRTLVLEDLNGFAGYLGNVERIGVAIGAVEQASALRERFLARQRVLEAKRPPEAERPSVVGWDYGYVPGAQTSFDDVARTAGFVNLPAREGMTGHQRLDAEQLVAWDPQWIVIGCGEQSCASSLASFAEQPGLGRLGAVAAGHVIAIESRWLSSTGEGMLELAAQLQAPLLEGS
jgi:ABC-type Fe3+-hydroxamate transport system substrate-binding protein